MNLLWSRILAGAQVLGGIGLVGWSVLFYGVAGWGINFSDLGWNVRVVLPWLAPLAIGPVLAARRSADGRRRLLFVGAACAIAVVMAIISAVVGDVPAGGTLGAPPHPEEREPVPWALLLVLVPLAIAAFFLGFATLAIPVLAARTRPGRVLASVPFALGFVIAAYPERLVAPDDLREWLLATVAMLVSLGVALVVVGVQALRDRGDPSRFAAGD